MTNLTNYVFVIIIVILIMVLIYMFFIKTCPDKCSINYPEQPSYPVNPITPVNPAYPDTPANPTYPEEQTNSSDQNESNFPKDTGSEDTNSYDPPYSAEFPLSTKSWKSTCFVGWGMTLSSGFNDFIEIAHNAGITHIILEFILTKDNNTLEYYDSVRTWGTYSDSDKNMLLKKMNDYGITLMASFGGATTFPNTGDGLANNGINKLVTGNYKYSNSKTLANDLVTWLIANKIYAIDLDIEHLPMDASNNPNFNLVVEYLGSLSKYIKQKGQEYGQYIIVSHAPQTPYYNGGSYWGQPYNKIEEKYGQYIDFYNIQYYNQGDIYTNYNSIFVKDEGGYNAAILQLINANNLNSSYFPIPDFKIVLGKVIKSQALNGFVELYSSDPNANTLNNYINANKSSSADPKLQKWYKCGGAMIWFYYTLNNDMNISNEENMSIVNFFKSISH